jgi:hypothetical protein
VLTLDDERLGYRALNVDQTGSIYEPVMGFELHAAERSSIAILEAVGLFPLAARADFVATAKSADCDGNLFVPETLKGCSTADSGLQYRVKSTVKFWFDSESEGSNTSGSRSETGYIFSARVRYPAQAGFLASAQPPIS